ncbi:hypothetical protein AMAG_18829 [Allomyces macrogynus ATCC 38327]|uniref:Metaxin glutathione S-transferase domain-containing protein n=1 Tax=Allomyces macrogynus (strain ATCC 38327) TaxID=578462 RepID=A0A0L0SIR3_ALLM3|nr:hypothetical protein AMAG_18829 [Allomyces macrogynus ATCC 38327]|eukprot:KNE62230.1 hypothetical protein AMAG_18829 [Allomyces macrogynus ATCC 38327]
MGLLLYAWGPLAGPSRRPLPTVDADCLAAVTYLRLANAKFELVEHNDPSLSHTGHLPVLQDETALFHGLDAVLARKSDKAAALDAHLTALHKADRAAVEALVRDHLEPVRQYMWNLDARHTSTTHSRYKPLLPLIPRWLHLHSARRAVARKFNAAHRTDWLTHVLAGDRKPTVRPPAPSAPTPSLNLSLNLSPPAQDDACTWSRADVMHVARALYTTIAAILGDYEFMAGGDTPSSLDAVMFGALAMHYYPAFPDAESAAPPADADADADAEKPAPVAPRDDPPTLAYLLTTEFPSLVAYIDRVYDAARIGEIVVAGASHEEMASRAPVPVDDGFVARVRRFARSDAAHALLSVAAGAALLAGYIGVVRAAEERRVASAVEEVRRVQVERRRVAVERQEREVVVTEEKRELEGAEEERDENEEHAAVVAELLEDEDDGADGDDDE